MAPSDPAAGPAVAVLLLWHRAAVDHRSPVADELLERGFARLRAPTVEELRQLPQPADVGVRLADGGLHIVDGPHTLLEGARYRASDEWHAAARAGGVTLLVDVEPGPERDPAGHDEPGGDLAAKALARLATACGTGAAFGARIELIVDDRSAPPVSSGGS
jgi:hypothetical protein